MPVMPHAIHPGPRWPLHDTAATRRIEQAAANTLPAHTLSAHLIRTILEDIGVQPYQIDEVILGQILTAYQGLVKSGNTTDYINNATAGIQASAIVPGFQSLIDGTMKPQQFVDSIQAQYDKEVK